MSTLNDDRGRDRDLSAKANGLQAADQSKGCHMHMLGHHNTIDAWLESKASGRDAEVVAVFFTSFILLRRRRRMNG